MTTTTAERARIVVLVILFPMLVATVLGYIMSVMKGFETPSYKTRPEWIGGIEPGDTIEQNGR